MDNKDILFEIDEKLKILIKEAVKECELDSPNPHKLATYCTKLSAQLYWLGSEMAKAELDESAKLVDLLTSSTFSGDKKMSVAEGEKRAVEETRNRYGLIKNLREAVIEVTNSLKKRIEVLGWEFQSTKTNL